MYCWQHILISSSASECMQSLFWWCCQHDRCCMLSCHAQATVALLLYCYTSCSSPPHYPRYTLWLCNMGVSVYELCRCTVAGGFDEAVSHYEDAVTAAFSLQLDCHRHVQPHRSRKDGQMRWARIEMWPMPVRIASRGALCIVTSVVTTTLLSQLLTSLLLRKS